MKTKMFEVLSKGSLNFRNRIVMSALTRCRADPNTGIPNELHVKYYTERAEEAGFILTECTSVSLRGNAFPGACGIWNEEQVEGWKKVCDSVHNVNGKIYMQIWHGGRATKSKYTGSKPLAPSSVSIRIPKKNGNGLDLSEEPQEMSENDIIEVLGEFKKGAENAKRAGFDGLELHGANGYLIDTFLRDSTNKRSDSYGGSIENRCRFPLMVIDVLSEIFGSEKVGIKITPVGRYNDMFDSDPVKTYSYFLTELSKRNISFIELARAPEFVPSPNLYGIEGEDQISDVYTTFRKFFNGIIIGNNSFTPDEALKYIDEGKFDMISFGRLFISNPDLVSRIKNGWEMSKPNYKTFYTPGKEGYIDYPKYNIIPKF